MGNCSSSVLADRLNALSRAGIVEKLPDKTYELTAHRGGALGAALEGVWQWADVNAEELTGGLRRQEAGAPQNARRRN
ncbi:hypothetical protein GPOL_174p01610 (plasmid) [Gordonia polyisoprenivorans VH2]|uniref:HTH hxlR-type domain-containing protein n=2 Tax=Gordonia polyisoprenivorans TaxID=84595 RepID=H6N5D5_GORPV|nr:hypothetical protein GPOL_174p01610 [Gordonia polyisoprenivorans VH2]